MAKDPKVFILGEVKSGTTLPDLVKHARSHGLTEGQTRAVAQKMLERGELRLDQKMRLQLPSEETTASAE